ncbi:hypothetical protein KXQ82_03295 [Mucilaginibacter sp. HMF5004]|uniref:hypothetical protein n=1 Tax=Mucilaginibacter rivuli TaxID=2857527 RepID=UPI001C5FD380|nr:hypothetical protein [Mucilaginibacter rivuli]MBW4888719.1 hypothetical protein [Mucilaginibacter rivuli]
MKIRDSNYSAVHRTSLPTLKKVRHNRSTYPAKNHSPKNYLIDDDCLSDSKSNEQFNENSIFDLKIKTRVPLEFKISLNEEIVGHISVLQIDIYDAINKSKYILDLKDDWDTEGAKGYHRSTWIKAVKFLISYSNWVRKLNKKLPAPQILQGPNGSIDIFWKNDSFLFLVNISEQGDSSFYGDDYGKNKSEGFFDPLNPILKIFPIIFD